MDDERRKMILATVMAKYADIARQRGYTDFAAEVDEAAGQALTDSTAAFAEFGNAITSALENDDPEVK